jgi:wyosine [tRNA(Phe)-imidazoG37] synthetase (radical SAM superfamily)
MKYQYLFGPVPSRRLGASLGVDLLPFKTCTFNCVYCECGPTNHLTNERKEYVPTEKVIEELDGYLSAHPKIDYITFSGSGEPTLHKGLDKVINFLKARYPSYKISVLTNGSLLFISEVQDALKKADVVIPSLDAVSPDIFQKINRPAPSISIEKIIIGLIDFRKKFSGSIWLEFFLVPGVNDSYEEIERIGKVLHQIQPDKVQINTLDRPGTEDWVKPADSTIINRIIDEWKGLPVESIRQIKRISTSSQFNFEIKEQILATLRRRPCTAEDLAAALGLSRAEVNKYIAELLKGNLLKSQRLDRGVFFSVRN